MVCLPGIAAACERSGAPLFVAHVVRFFRLAIGGYYRMTTDIRFADNIDVSSNVLDGFSGGITLKFGKF